MTVKVTELNETTTPVDSDVLPIVTNTGSAPETQKIRFDSLLAAYAKAAEYLALAGGTVTGQIKGITPVAAADLTRKDYVDAADALKLNLTGGTVEGFITAEKFISEVGSLGTTTGTVGLNFNTSGDFKTHGPLTGNVDYVGISYNAGSSVTVRVLNGSTLRELTFPAGWRFVGTKPEDIEADKVGILTVTSFGTTEALCVAAWAVES